MNKSSNQDLHLPDLQIKGLRDLRKFVIPKFGKVTLLARRNGIGKTTVLEAVELWTKRGKNAHVAQLLLERDEYTLAVDDDDVTVATSFIAFFLGRVRLRDQRLKLDRPKRLTLIS